jgi:hypothetical protein
VRQKHKLESVVLQQDGGRPHFEVNGRTFHDDNFRMWSGYHGSAAWPPALPDLTSCDFSMRGIIKDDVHSNQAYVLRMKEQICVEFSNLSFFANWHSSANLTEVYPCLFLSCKANARVYLFLISELYCFVYCLCCFMYCLCVNVYCTSATGCQPNCS